MSSESSVCIVGVVVHFVLSCLRRKGSSASIRQGRNYNGVKQTGGPRTSGLLHSGVSFADASGEFNSPYKRAVCRHTPVMQKIGVFCDVAPSKVLAHRRPPLHQPYDGPMKQRRFELPAMAAIPPWLLIGATAGGAFLLLVTFLTGFAVGQSMASDDMKRSATTTTLFFSEGGSPSTTAPTTSPPPPANQSTPADEQRTASNPRQLLNQLRIADPVDPAGYSRDAFPMWLDLDGNGCDARDDVLTTESQTAAIRSGCDVVAGSWTSIYDGVQVTKPGQLDIDHVVALGEAWRSGAHLWTTERRAAFANDLNYPDHLIAVTAASNRSKSDSPPNEWRPPQRSSWCRYATAWTTIKIKWELTATAAERDALGQMLETCAEK